MTACAQLRQTDPSAFKMLGVQDLQMRSGSPEVNARVTTTDLIHPSPSCAVVKQVGYCLFCTR